MANLKKPTEAPQSNSEETTQEKDMMINIGGLWLNESKKGDVYLSGCLNGARLLILPNNFKKSDKEPDFVMNVLPYRESKTDSETAKSKLKSKLSKKDESENKDDIPF